MSTTVDHAAALFEAFESGTPIEPLTATAPHLTIDDAYAIQRALVARHVDAGRRVVGRKIGLTSAAIQTQLGVDSPDFGVLFTEFTYRDASTLSLSGDLRPVLPRLEAEIGFVLAEPLAGPGITAQDVRDATSSIMPVFELIDSRIQDWRIRLVDTVADNASGLGAVLGAPLDADDAGAARDGAMTITRDGTPVAEGLGTSVLGDPAVAVAWLANELGARGDVLPAGEPILSGSWSAAVDAGPGHYVADFGPRLGSVQITIAE